MRASTELFLWHMSTIAGSLYRPSLRHFDESFEGWAYRKGLLRQMQRLETEAFLEKQQGGKGDRVYRLTPKGRLAALGGKDPEELWKRPWDGHWRLLMFDLPQFPKGPRSRLRKVLHEHGMGCIQGSVWLSPDSLDKIRKQLWWGDRHPSSLLLFEGRTVGGEKPRELVIEAWDFDAIKVNWSVYLNFLEQGERFLASGKTDAVAFRQWSEKEHTAWKQVIEVDPFLPGQLLPSGYTGRKIWKKRVGLWQKLALRMQRDGFS